MISDPSAAPARAAGHSAPVQTSAAYLFPSFPMRDPELRHERLRGFPELVDGYADRAARVVEVTPRTFAPPEQARFGSPLEATLQAQYACYVESTALARWLERRYPPCGCVAGYSMGLFAAAHHAGALRFEDGLRLVRDVCVAGHACAEGTAYALAAVFELELEAVERLLASAAPGVEVADVYGPRRTLVIGRADQVEAAVRACVAEGADTRIMPLTAPFHASALRRAEPGIADLLASVPVADPRVAFVSCGTQRLLRTAADVRDEITRNISHPMNWYATVQALAGMGVPLFLECGTSQRLAAMARRELPDHDVRDFLDFEALP